MSNKSKKVGGCKKRRRPHKVSQGLRRNIAKPHGRPPSSHGAQKA